MRKQIIFMVFLAILMAIAFSPAYAFDWDRVGGDPCTLSRVDAIGRLSIPKEVKSAVIEAYQTGNYELVKVPAGTIYNEMVFGGGKVKQDVYCTWRITPGPYEATSVTVDYDGYRYAIVRFTRCSNFCYNRKLLPPQKPVTIQYDEVSSQPVAPIVTPAPPELPLGPTLQGLVNNGVSGGRITNIAVMPNSAGPLVLPSQAGDINVNGENVNINENINTNENTNTNTNSLQQQQEQQQQQ